MGVNRRTFVCSTAGALAAYAAPPSDQVTLGVIGAGSRGTFVMTTFQKDPSLRVAAICDVYETNLEKAVSAASKIPGTHAKQYRNYKDLLADKDVQAVLIATPEHWHYQMVLDALAAGKDVYVEKPLCQTPEQGVALVEAEKKTKSIIQVGMQRRSFDLYIEGRRIVAAGQLGTVRMVRSWWLNNYLGGAPATRLDGKLDWEQWQGPASRHPDRKSTRLNSSHSSISYAVFCLKKKKMNTELLGSMMCTFKSSETLTPAQSMESQCRKSVCRSTVWTICDRVGVML